MGCGGLLLANTGFCLEEQAARMLCAGLTCQVCAGKMFVKGDLSDAVRILQTDLHKDNY